MTASVDFVADLNGDVTAEEVLDGETNQVKDMLEIELLALCESVIAEEFGNDDNGTTRDRRRRRRRAASFFSGYGRMLVVERCVSATVDDVQDMGE